MSNALSGGADSVDVILWAREPVVPAFMAEGLLGRVLVLGKARTMFETGLSGVWLRGLLKILVSGPAVHDGTDSFAMSVFRLLSIIGLCGISLSVSLDWTFGSLLKCGPPRERDLAGDAGRQKSLT